MKALLEQSREVGIDIDSIRLHGNLEIPHNASGIVLFAHGSGSSRHSPRNRYVAEVLREGGFATLLLDLLSEREEVIDLRTTRLRFDIAFLAERLLRAMKWMEDKPDTRDLHIGLFGSSTGAGAALMAAAAEPERIGAVVSRGGRPDLAASSLEHVVTPTLLIVGGNDTAVIDLNKQAMAQMRCEKKLEIVPRATHLFEEPGALEEVARLATEWFQEQL